MPSRVRHMSSRTMPHRRATSAVALVAVAVLAACGGPPAGGDPPTVTFAPRLFAPPGGATAHGVAVGSDGSVAVAYLAYGTAGGGAVAVPGAGLMVLEPDGAVRFDVAVGGPEHRTSEAVTEALDPVSGEHAGWWLVGETDGAYQSFVTRLDASGVEACRATMSGWSHGVARLGGGVVVVGEVLGDEPGSIDAVARRFTASCEAVWERTFGGPEMDIARDVTPYGNGFAVVGSARTASPWHAVGEQGTRPFAAVWDANGNLVWGSLLGVIESYGLAWGVAADPTSDDLFVTGFADGAFDPGSDLGGTVAFVARVRPGAADPIVWNRYVGSSESDNGLAIAAAPNGDVVAVGGTRGAVAAAPNAGSDDAWVARISGAGVVRWTWQAGSVDFDVAYGVATTAGGQTVTVGVAADGFLGLQRLETEGDGSSAYHGFIVMHLADGSVAP